MLSDLIAVALSATLTVLVAFPLAGALKRHPVPFYAVALALVVGYLAYQYGGAYVRGATAVLDVIRKGYLACMLLAVVMFIGVFDEGSAVRRRLQPVRAELSILSSILVLGHVLAYLPIYLPRLGAIFSSHVGMSLAVVVAIVLVVVYALLSVTSLRAVRTRMPYRTWKGLQRLSYAMVALLMLHIALALGRPAFAARGSSTSALVALCVYAVLVVAYTVARLAKFRRDHRGAALDAARLADDGAMPHGGATPAVRPDDGGATPGSRG